MSGFIPSSDQNYFVAGIDGIFADTELLDVGVGGVGVRVGVELVEHEPRLVILGLVLGSVHEPEQLFLEFFRRVAPLAAAAPDPDRDSEDQPQRGLLAALVADTLGEDDWKEDNICDNPESLSVSHTLTK